MENEEKLKQLAVNIPCQGACPIMTDVGGYIEAIVREDNAKAYEINRIDNVLPGILGRVCRRPPHGRLGRGDKIDLRFFAATIPTARSQGFPHNRLILLPVNL